MMDVAGFYKEMLNDFEQRVSGNERSIFRYEGRVPGTPKVGKANV